MRAASSRWASTRRWADAASTCARAAWVFGMEDLHDVLARANARTHLFVQIETVEAVANVDEILAVEGLSGIFMGPGDLAVDMGCTGQMGDPKLREGRTLVLGQGKGRRQAERYFHLAGAIAYGRYGTRAATW